MKHDQANRDKLINSLCIVTSENLQAVQQNIDRFFDNIGKYYSTRSKIIPEVYSHHSFSSKKAPDYRRLLVLISPTLNKERERFLPCFLDKQVIYINPNELFGMLAKNHWFFFDHLQKADGASPDPNEILLVGLNPFLPSLTPYHQHIKHITFTTNKSVHIPPVSAADRNQMESYYNKESKTFNVDDFFATDDDDHDLPISPPSNKKQKVN